MLDADDRCYDRRPRGVARAESRGVSAGLRGIVVPASWIALPTTGAEVSSAKERQAGGVAYCRVMGRIHPVGSAGRRIFIFELNLPEVWNGKALRSMAAGRSMDTLGNRMDWGGRRWG